ncbi:30S ribosomal protein S19e [Candidatus Micrarchaeota archaeon]|nr:30S ribosomal protein S19e [Candidatus Micrarchaeota archaeon]
MIGCLDVDANALIEKVAEKLEEMKIEKPDFVSYAKSGAHTERPPAQKNFWYLRCASVMRQAYSRGNVGTQRLRRHYGGRKNRGVKPERHMPAGGSLIRKAFQSLEKAGLMKKSEKEGRVLTGAGRKLLDQTAREVSKSA